MRVAINALAVEPRRPGGDVTYVRELVRWLPRVAPDDEWIVFTSRSGRPLLDADSAAVQFITCPVAGQSLVARALWEQLQLPRWVQRAGVDVLHAPVNVAPIAARVPVVLTLHEAEPFMPDNRIPLPLLAWWRTLRAWSARRAQRVLTVSHSAKADLVRWMGIPAPRLHVVPLGVDTARFTPGPSEEPAPLGGEPYILWIGRPYPGKNLARLIAAFSELRRRGRPERLVLLGPAGWAEPDIGRVADACGCADAVMRLPAVWDDVPRWYRGCAVFVYPSTRESFGLPVLEAMACGAAVIASALPALREIGSEAVVYVDPLRVQSVVEALWSVLASPDKRTALRQAGPRHAQRFSWTQTARETWAHYAAAWRAATGHSGMR